MGGRLSTRARDEREPKTKDIVKTTLDQDHTRTVKGFRFICKYCNYHTFVYESLDTLEMMRREHYEMVHPTPGTRRIKVKHVEPTGGRAYPRRGVKTVAGM